jgi:hypothetical protein
MLSIINFVNPDQTYDFDVALSYAGEQRPYVYEVVDCAKLESESSTTNSLRRNYGDRISTRTLIMFTEKGRVLP